MTTPFRTRRPSYLKQTRDAGDADDPMLLEEMRGKVLAMRGLQAGPDELLMALSSRHALQLGGDLLVRRGTQVVLQQPTEPAFERRVRAYGPEVSVLDPALPPPTPPGPGRGTTRRPG